MNSGKVLLWGGLIYGLFVAGAVFALGAYIEVSASLAVRIVFACCARLDGSSR